MTSTLPATLAEYTDDELALFYGGASDDAGPWRSMLEAEMERRDAEQAAAKARRAASADYRVSGPGAAWYEAAHAQYLAAERECAGRLLSAEGFAETSEPMTLWTGTDKWARRLASEELKNWWETHPRLTPSEFQRQAAGERRAWIDRHDREAGSNDYLDANAAGSVRRITSQGQGGARARADSRGNDVPGSPARSAAQDRYASRATAGPGRAVRGGRVSETTSRTEELRRRAAMARERLAAVSGDTVAGEQEPGQVADVPAAYVSSTAVVERRAAVIQARQAIDGDQVLRYIYTYLSHFAAWGSDAEIVAAALWIAQTHARNDKGYPVWQYCARLAILGPSGSGKSWKSRLIGKLSSSGEILVEPTAPAFIDLCADNHTIVLTEADEAFRSPGRSRKIVAVANASYEPDRTSSRKQGGVAVKIPLFCHLVLDGIDDVLLSPNRPDLRAMMTRAILVMSRKAPEGYRPPRFDSKARAAAELLSQRTAAWMAQEVAAGMADDVPDVPEHLGNRPFALWEPLFIVALRADQGDPEGPWSTACREACEQLEAVAGVVDQTEDQTSELDRIMAGFGGDEF